MSTSLKITVEQFEAMVDRGDFEPIEEHNVELIRGEIVPRFGDDPRTPMNPPHANASNELLEWSFEVVSMQHVQRCFSNPGSVGFHGSTANHSPIWPGWSAGIIRKFTLHPMKCSSSSKSPTPLCGKIRERSSNSTPRPEFAITGSSTSRAVASIVYRDPQGLIFRDIETYRVGQEIHPLAFPDVSLPVSRLFPA